MRIFKAVPSFITALIGWVFFCLLWWWVFTHRANAMPEFRNVVPILVFCAFIIISALLWVRYNVWLYKHNKWTGPDPKQTIAHDYGRDATGVPVDADFNALREARFVVIEITGTNDAPAKSYQSQSDKLTTEEAAVCEI